MFSFSNVDFAPRPTCRAQGFTLIELLSVIAIISLLSMASIGSFAKAKKLAKTTKAESELRELVSAFTQYCVTYPDPADWPSGNVDDKEVDASLLNYVASPDGNAYGIVFLNITLPQGSKYLDPWGKPYRLTFNTKKKSTKSSTIALETTIALPFRDMHEDL